MGGLDKIIQQLHGATADLKADNDRAEFMAQQRERFAKAAKSRAVKCGCNAYPFPHRRGGGKCCEEQHAIRQTSLVPYHHTRQAMFDAGHNQGDFA